MSVIVRRVLLGLCSAVAIIGGGALVVMVVLYFGPTGYVHELQVGGYGIFAGMIGLGLYLGSVFRGHMLARIAIGVCSPFVALGVSVVVAKVVSLFGDPGGERGNLEDGAMGAQWLLAGGYLAWCAIAGRVSQRRASREPVHR